MSKNKIFISFILIIFSFFYMFSQELPELTGRIVDNVGVLSQSEKGELEQLLTNYENITQHQIAVAIIPDLQEYDIESFSIALAENWKIGRKNHDDGIIIFIAIDDRLMRIEVGYGLEGEVTDNEAGLIIRNIMKPAFREGNYYEGIKGAIDKLANLTGADESIYENTDIVRYEYVKTSKTPRFIFGLFLFLGFILGGLIRAKKKGKKKNPFIVPLLFFLILISLGTVSLFFFIGISALLQALGATFFGFIFAIIRLGGFGYYSMGSGRRSSGGFFGGSSGGFSGGGGSFGGGGASGSW